MHSGIILLTEATEKDEALSNVNIFLEDYYNIVFDYYNIGGRWHNMLAPEDKLDKFKKWVKKKYSSVFNKDGSYFINDLENEKDKVIIQNKWEKLGLLGQNIYYDSYGFNLNSKLDNYNCVPLIACLNTVKKWCNDREKLIKEYWKNMLIEKKKEDKTKIGTMSAYYAEKYAKAMYNNFSLDMNVYNINTLEIETIPKDIENYFAVIVDFHN
jgi:hypothetical protein